MRTNRPPHTVLDLCVRARRAGDGGGDSQVTVGELIDAVAAVLLGGSPAASPT